MARQVVQTLHSDLSGEIIPDSSDGGTVEFTVSGTSYSIDLTEAELAEFNQVLAPYVGAAQRLTRRGRPVVRTQVKASQGTRRSKEQLASIRSWAKANGHEVSERGRIASNVLEAFDAAH